MVEALHRSGLLSEDVADRAFGKRMDSRHTEAGDSGPSNVIQLGVHVSNPISAAAIPLVILLDIDQRDHEGVRVLFPAHVRADARIAVFLGISADPLLKPAAGDGDPFDWKPDWIYTHEAGELQGKTGQDGCEEIVERLRALGHGNLATRYRLRDWNIARQRYWGPPVPIVHCGRCGLVPVPYEHLPVSLPLDVDLDTYENPLKTHRAFVNVPCPKCGQHAARDSDTLEAYSSPWWYHWNCKGTATANPFDLTESRLYMPINLMVGGEDQARTCFFHVRMMARALKRAEVVEYEEPIDTLLALGMLKSEGRKMSKSEGNAVDPDLLIKKYGADAVRFGILGAAAPESDMNWSEGFVRRASNFLLDVWRFFDRNLVQIRLDNWATASIDSTYSLTVKLSRQVNTASARTTEALRQNYVHLAASNLVELFERLKQFEREALKRRTRLDARDCAALSVAGSIFLRLLAPLCPHITEEIWSLAYGPGMIAQAQWPVPVPGRQS